MIRAKWCRLRKHLAVLLACISLLVTGVSGLRAQVFELSDISSRYISEDMLDSMVLQKMYYLGAEKDVSPADIRNRYPAFKTRISQVLQAVMQHNYLLLDKKYRTFPDSGPSSEKARKEYLATAREAIDKTFEYSGNFIQLFEKDNTDRILSFHSEIRIAADGVIRVLETITVFNGLGYNSAGQGATAGRSDNDDIQRGIVRDFPTRYKAGNGTWTRTGFRLLAVRLNGKEEPYLKESLTNGTRILIGQKEVLLPEGVFRYELEYETRRQLIFHSNKDEFYWNVNGNGWVFSADTISCRVHFPAGAAIFEYDCYTGPQGSTARDCSARLTDSSSILFMGKKRFGPNEGLTIAASVRKGILQPPGSLDRNTDFLLTNYIVPVLSLLGTGMLLFYLLAWRRVGRDPAKGTIIPQFEPPASLRAAETGFLLHQQYTTQLFAASLVEAAVNRQLDIVVNKKGTLFKTTTYTFKKPTPAGRASIPAPDIHYGFSLADLYGQTASRGTYNSTLKSISDSLEKNLRKKFQNSGFRKSAQGMFQRNSGYSWLGGILLVVAIVVSFIFNLSYYSRPILIFTLLVLLAMVIIQVVFSRIMSSYTAQGRAVTDHIEGFRMYLKETEQPVYQQLAVPEKTLDLFEKYLPYAIALGVENEWAEKFDALLQKAIAEGYQPAYYHTGGSFGRSFTLGDLSRSMSSGLSGTISSASTPPSSSGGGSSGGGSSGGGGGGGGGGGW